MTAARYQVHPDIDRGWLAIWLAESTVFQGTPDGHGGVEIVAEGVSVLIPDSILVQLPADGHRPEPPDGTVVRVAGTVFHRDDEAAATADLPTGWWPATATGVTWSWEEICTLGDPVELTPEHEEEEFLDPWSALQDWLRFHPHYTVTIDPWGLYGCVELRVTHHTTGGTVIERGATLAQRCRDALTWMADYEKALQSP
jgi:hypothetical protein